MNRIEYVSVSAQPVYTTISVSARDLENQEDRTLLYGYTVDRDTWHVYLRDGVIHRFVYSPDYNVRVVPEPDQWAFQNVNALSYDYFQTWYNGEALIPSKRLYPNHCDYEFCSFMKSNGFSLPFGNWVEGLAGEPRGPFAGAVFSA